MKKLEDTLQQLYDKNVNADQLVKDLKKEQEELDKTIYIVKVFNLVNSIERTYIEDGFKNNAVESLHINYYCDAENDKDNSLSMYLIDNKAQQIYSLPDYKQISDAYRKLSEFRNFPEEYLNKKLLSNLSIKVNLDTTVKTQILEMLLNEELYAIFKTTSMYVQMDNVLEEKNVIGAKRKL